MNADRTQKDLHRRMTQLGALMAGLPRVRLGFFPTPLTRLDSIGALLGHDRLYMKRDDLTGVSLGGNKVRGLEFLLGEALELGATTVITGGGLQSNLCSLTAAACAKVGLECVLVHNDSEPVRPGGIRGNMLLNHLFGAKEVFLGPVSEDERARAMECLARDIRRSGSIPYVIHNGASTPTGSLGYLGASLEVLEQSRRAGTALKHVVIVGAMGGTAAGFVFGAAMLGRPFHVHVISVEYPESELRRRMGDLFSGLESLLGVTAPAPPEETMTIHDRYLGEGYGIPTPESATAARAFAQREGIILENVYTSKTAAGFLDLVESGVIPRTEPAACFHTGGIGALFSQD